MAPFLLIIAAFIKVDASPRASPKSDLYEIRIPAAAIERTVDKFRRTRTLATQKIYLIEGKVVAERFFFDDGNLAEEKLYRDYPDKLHGIWRQYHMNGKLAAERPYREGTMDGTFRFWDDNGDLLGESTIKEGTGMLRQFTNRALAVGDSETSFVNGKKNGPATEWGRFPLCQGMGVHFSKYVDGKLQGWSILRDEDGLLLSSAFIKRDQLHGVVREIDREGRPRVGYPKYYLDGEEVTEFKYREAASRDKQLQELLDYQPPNYAKVPEAPSSIAAKRIGAEKTKRTGDDDPETTSAPPKPQSKPK